MSINSTVTGNLITLALEGTIGGLVQGCNCFETMGSGLAPQIAKQWPGAAQVDKDFSFAGDPSKLGKVSEYIDASIPTMVINGYTQFGFGESAKGGRDVNYGAVAQVFTHLEAVHVSMIRGIGFSPFTDEAPLGVPKIGAQLAGGDWDIIFEIINQCAPTLPMMLVEWDGTIL